MFNAWALRPGGGVRTGVGCSSYSPGQKYLNQDAFSAPGAFQLGDTRFLPSARPCGYMNENIAFQKTFPFQERYQLDFAAEFINIFNRHNFRSLATNVENSNFGQFGGTTKPRRIQFHLKFTF